jgi:hypothetical protein
VHHAVTPTVQLTVHRIKSISLGRLYMKIINTWSNSFILSINCYIASTPRWIKALSLLSWLVFFMLITDLLSSTLVAMILIAIASREKINMTGGAICNDLQLHQF